MAHSDHDPSDATAAPPRGPAHAHADDAHDHPHGHEHPHGVLHHDPHAVPATPLPHGAGVGKVLHIDCFHGIAGDMFVAAMLDLGVPMEALQRALDALPVRGYSLEVGRKVESSVSAARFVVHVNERQPHRRFRDIRAMLDGAALPEGVRRRAVETFRRLAEAEGRIHRMPPDDVHFHEVGAVDAIVDIVSASAALEWLGARVTCAPVPMSHGFVRAQHGVLPVPAPAVVEVLHGVPTYGVPVEGEIVTPTGAAIVRAQATSFARWPAIAPIATGFGAGTKSFPGRPNLLRVVLGSPAPEAADVASDHTHEVLEANLDDATGQVVGHVTEALLRGGALDTWTTPIGMKKGRPGVMVSALVARGERERVGKLLLSESTSLGLRWRPAWRMERPRATETVSTRFGDVPVKVADGDGLAPSATPEFDVCRDLAAAHKVPARVVVAAAMAAWWAMR